MPPCDDSVLFKKGKIIDLKVVSSLLLCSNWVPREGPSLGIQLETQGYQKGYFQGLVELFFPFFRCFVVFPLCSFPIGSPGSVRPLESL